MELCHIYNSVTLMEALRGLLYCTDYMIGSAFISDFASCPAAYIVDC